MRATSTRLVALSQATFFGLLLVCLALHPGYLVARNEGGISNYGVHLRTVVPYSIAFAGCAVLLVTAARVLAVSGSHRPLGRVLTTFAVLLVCVLATTYPYQHGTVLRDLHFAVGAVATGFEVAAGAWLVATGPRTGVGPALLAVELAGFALGVLTTAGALHVLFVSQLVTAGAFGAILVRACATRDLAVPARTRGTTARPA